MLLLSRAPLTPLSRVFTAGRRPGSAGSARVGPPDLQKLAAILVPKVFVPEIPESRFQTKAAQDLTEGDSLHARQLHPLAARRK